MLVSTIVLHFELNFKNQMKHICLSGTRDYTELSKAH